MTGPGAQRSRKYALTIIGVVVFAVAILLASTQLFGVNTSRDAELVVDNDIPAEDEINFGSVQEISIEVAFPQLTFPRMVFLTHPGDSSNRIFVVLQPGQIVVFNNTREVDSFEVFLDIRERVNDSGNEEGLLGLAFDPAFSENGEFYVYYTASQPRRSILSRFSVDDFENNRADPESEIIILEVNQPFGNHNGGMIAFGPDKYLYLGLGDGGSGGDPRGNGQNRNTLLGSILRIDVSDTQAGYSIPQDNPFYGVENVMDEIWAYGFRNPWRFSFDRQTGFLWVGDVGQGDFEEVDIVEKGGNYGWNVMEGPECFSPRFNCRDVGLEEPIVYYSHSEGCSITGGYVYRGSTSNLDGAYIYGDYCSGKIWLLRYDGLKVIEHVLLADSDLQISSFGEDQEGELYILSFDGKIYLFKPAV
ncbi:MAG: sorbosone dehydrogenase family protein [Nitrososphaerales archaeon]